MRVYELMSALSRMPAGAEVYASPTVGDGDAIEVDGASNDGDGIVSIMLNGSYEDHIESEDDAPC